MSNEVEFIHSTDEKEKRVVDKDVQTVLSGEVDVTPENVVKVTQMVRTGILRQITDHGTRLPTDDDGIKTALNVLRDMDHTALTTSKLDIEEKKANSAAQVAAIADNILSKMSLGQGSVKNNIESEIDLPEVDLLDGEIDQGEKSLNPDVWLMDRE